MFKPSKYQQDFFDALLSGSGDILLNAVAGSGKTKSIEEAAKRLPAALRSETLMTAFNKHIERELTERQKRGDIPAGITISTIHGLGYRVCRRAFEPKDAKNWIDEKKYRKLTQVFWDGQNLTEEERRSDEARDSIGATEEMVRLAMLTLTNAKDPAALLAMAAHFGVEVPSEYETILLRGVPQILHWGMNGLPSPDRDGLAYHPKQRISFDDMVFLPNALSLTVPTFKLCFIDECQDFNRAQQELLLKAKGKGRACFVGDRRQAIYGFTGADAESFERIQRVTGAKELPLSICYRCSKEVVRWAQSIVPNIEAADSAIRGAVLQVEEEQLVELALNHHRNPATRREPFMILCRVNAPLIKTAFALIAKGVPAKVKGRDIGAAIIKTVDAISELRGFNFADFVDFAELYRRQQTHSLERKNGSEMQIANLCDRVDSALAVHTAVVAAGKDGLADMRAYIEGLFSNEDEAVVLSSIHKAKGLEANKVGILEADLLPHPMAKQAWQVEQEKNLAYVAITRAREELYISGKIGFGPNAKRPEEAEALAPLPAEVAAPNTVHLELDGEVFDLQFPTPEKAKAFREIVRNNAMNLWIQTREEAGV